MIRVDYKALVKKLNTYSKKAFEGAAGLCVSSTHYDLELEHFLYKLVDDMNGDWYQILRKHRVEKNAVIEEIVSVLNTMKTGNGNIPGLSPRIPRLLQDAWMLGSVEYGARSVRSGFIFIALMQAEDMPPVMRRLRTLFKEIPLDELKNNFYTVVQGSSEQIDSADSMHDESTDTADIETAGTSQAVNQLLSKYTINLTQQAREKKLDPVVGRDREIRDTIDILIRRRKNNPLLIGDAGVGKTAVVEGLALRIAEGDVPESLKNVSLVTLDIGSLQAGAGIRGEFENRLKGVIKEVTASAKPIVLFIDEIHTIMGAGGKEGTGDAANLLKPALARGQLRTIGATTRTEYKQFISKDAALERRFQTIEIEEPDIATAVLMLRTLVPHFENHHNVHILEDAVTNAVSLSSRYITGRLLPDKAVDLIDTACARVALGAATVPAEIERCKHDIEHIDLEISRLKRENCITDEFHSEKIDELETTRIQLHDTLEKLQSRWNEEKEKVAEIKQLRDNAEQSQDQEEKENLFATIKEKIKELETVQGTEPLVQIHVDGQTVANVVSSWTGIPVGKMIRNEMEALLSIKEKLAERVKGQEHALEIIGNRLRTARYNLSNPDQPIGIFLLVGPSGIGKTETALVLSDVLFGGEKNIVSLNMSEFKEQHASARLIGPPPGYVGFGKGGLLTEKVRHRPYSVVLLDEIEKAHHDVREFFQQVFDKGYLTDTEGQIANFRNTIIIMTANIGDETIIDCCFEENDNGGLRMKDPLPAPEHIVKKLHPELLKTFSSALLARMTIVPYYPLTDQVLDSIIQNKLTEIRQRLAVQHKIELEYSDDVIALINARCTEVQSGARNINRIINDTILPQISGRIIERLADGIKTNSIKIETTESDEFIFELS